MSVQLRVRTEFSFGRTFCKLQKAVDTLKEMGVTAAAVVDNNTWGHVPWFEACTKAGIQPMLGVECIVNDDEDRTTMWFIAATTQGLSELYRAISNAHRQPVSGRSGKAPRLYRSDVEAMSDQIIKFAGDITDGEWLKSIGAFVDLNPASRLLNATKKKTAERWGLECVRTGDNAYAVPSDLPLLQIVAGGAEKTTPQHLIPIEPDPVHDRIVEMTKGLQLPKAPMVRTPGDLEALCREGIGKRGWTAESWPADYEERLKYELDLIRSKDFDSYFLVVADMCRYAKANMLVGPSRGSAAGSLVCYLAGITEIDPMPPKLYFERFIDVTRTDLPDIDLDFPGIKRHMVFEYMAEKYGAANTAHIGTVGRFKPKSALIEVCKALNIPPAATAAVKMNIIERGIADSRASNCLEDTFKETDAGRQFAAMYPQALVAGEIEGHSSHTGVHAAGLLVCNEPITNFCVVDAEGIAHVEKGPAEKLGLLKIDVLGLRTLDVLEDCGVPIDWYALKPDDPAVFEVFNKQQFCGIFQFEGNAMRSLSTRIHFDTIKEIDAVTALARPGPFSSGVTEKYIKRHNGEKWEPVHPQVDALMQDAYGLPLYQEHTLAIVREIGKFGWNETSFVRKAISKRQGQEFFQKFFPPFLEGALSQGIPEAAARATWESINAMGAWQMNKCTAEGTLVRITANNTGLPIWCPIEKLYEKYVENPSSWIRQRKSMPRLLSLFPDGRGRPQVAKAIYKNGKKPCVRLVFDDGTSTRCTADHKFIVNGEWLPCGEASAGDEFTALQRGNSIKPTGGIPHIKSGRTVAVRDFKISRKGCGCDDCGSFKKLEVHHNDLNHGHDRPYDLAWVCSSCHKLRHKSVDNWGVPFEFGHEQTRKRLVSIEDAGELMTYDIEMPEEHNYVIDGGIVTHNSHTYSYAMISYWTAYLKRHHPLEFAAATLRNAKDDESALELLREMSREGIEMVPFDLQHSQVNWSVHNGKLLGGFLNLHGFGAVNSAKIVAARDAGTLTPKQLEKIEKAENKFSDIFPFHNRYRDIYDNPGKHNINGEVWDICRFDGTQRGSHVFLGEIIYKNHRDANESVNVAKRGGKILTGPTAFLDLRVRDDTGMIGVRFGRFDYERLGRYFAEKVPVGAHVMIRGDFIKDIRFSFVQNAKVLT